MNDGKWTTVKREGIGGGAPMEVYREITQRVCS